jgi:hypothetical protein
MSISSKIIKDISLRFLQRQWKMAELKFNYRRRLIIKTKYLGLSQARSQMLGTFQQPIQDGLNLRLGRKKRSVCKLIFDQRRKS